MPTDPVSPETGMIRRAETTKASVTGPVIALHHTGRPVWTPRDYGALAREGYMKNPVVYRAVRMISEAAASAPWLLYDGARELDEHPLLKTLTRPNGLQDGATFLEQVYGHLLVSGNAYVERVVMGGELRELYALRPDRMKIIPDSRGWPEAYEYTVDGRSVRFSADGIEGGLPVLHLRMFHPSNDFYGFAPIEAARTSLDIHNASSVWNKALLDNSARPSGALMFNSPQGTAMTAEQFENLRRELDREFSGPDQAGRPLLLEGGLQWESMSMSPRDMDYLEGKHSAAREVALAFGVLPMLLGIPGDNTYSNYREANRAFWRQTVLPLISRTAAAFSNWLSHSAEDRIRLVPDLDQVEALTEERENLWNRLNTVDFLTVNEKREAAGYSPVPGGDRPPAALER